jgi:diguanylate cyclase (GGDEF)-like protein
MCSLRDRHVLMVDSNPRRRHQRSKLLRDLGLAVHEASSCRAALLSVKQRRPELVVLGGPFADGGAVELCRRIKADSTAAGTRLLHLAEAPEPEGSLADGYLVEPVEADEFQDYVKRVLNASARDGFTLEARANHYRELLNALPVAAYITDADGWLKLYNERAATLWGRRPDIGVERWCGSLRLYQPDGTLLPHGSCPMAQALRDQLPVPPQDILIERPDGSRVRAVPSPTPLRDAAGALLGALNVFLVGGGRESLWTTVAENTAEGVFVTDAQGGILAANPAFLRIAGCRETELAGTGLGSLPLFKDIWDSLASCGSWLGEVWAPGRGEGAAPLWLVANAVPGLDGETLNYVGVLTDIAPVKATLERLEYLAHHDPLTGLPNRLLLLARLEHALIQARRPHCRVALLFVDLDRFKEVNDTLGHAAGDALLKAVAGRLRDQVRQQDTVARFGGDEFVVVLEDIADEAGINHVQEKIVRALARPLLIDGHELTMTASIGACVYPRDGRTAEALLKSADAAMYRAKHGGRGNAQRMGQARAPERRAVEEQLRRAIAQDELVLHYQPRIDLKTGQVSGLEALVRWNHPERGLIPPRRFLPLAAEAGLIRPLGEWVLKHACAQARDWADSGTPFGRLSVNVAGAQLQRGGLIQTVRRALDESGLQAGRLELEMSETQLMGQDEPGLEQLAALRDLGVTLTIDDFGMRSACIDHLARLPVTTLKLDRSLVGELQAGRPDETVLRALIALGHGLRLSVTAEGVEEAGQCSLLAEHCCDHAQGFFISKPLPAPAIAGLVRSLAAAPAWPPVARDGAREGRMARVPADA